MKLYKAKVNFKGVFLKDGKSFYFQILKGDIVQEQNPIYQENKEKFEPLNKSVKPILDDNLDNLKVKVQEKAKEETKKEEVKKRDIEIQEDFKIKKIEEIKEEVKKEAKKGRGRPKKSKEA